MKSQLSWLLPLMMILQPALLLAEEGGPAPQKPGALKVTAETADQAEAVALDTGEKLEEEEAALTDEEGTDLEEDEWDFNDDEDMAEDEGEEGEAPSEEAAAQPTVSDAKVIPA